MKRSTAILKYLALPTVAAIFITALIVACTDDKQYGPKLLTPCVSGDYTVDVRFVSQAELERLYKSGGGVINRDGSRKDQLLGFTARDSNGQERIYVTYPRGQEDASTFETLGHELAHVTCGNWHPETNLR